MVLPVGTLVVDPSEPNVAQMVIGHRRDGRCMAVYVDPPPWVQPAHSHAIHELVEATLQRTGSPLPSTSTEAASRTSSGVRTRPPRLPRNANEVEALRRELHRSCESWRRSWERAHPGP